MGVHRCGIAALERFGNDDYEGALAQIGQMETASLTVLRELDRMAAAGNGDGSGGSVFIERGDRARQPHRYGRRIGCVA